MKTHEEPGTITGAGAALVRGLRFWLCALLLVCGWPGAGPSTVRANTLADSLRLSNAMLIKIPCDGTKPFADVGHWHFQHVLAGPKENGRVNHWYLVWNDEQPVEKALGARYWGKTLADAPAIVEATRCAFKAGPLLMEPNHTFRLKASAKLGALPGSNAGLKLSRTSAPVSYGRRTTPAWPDVRGGRDAGTGKPLVDPFWYRADDYTELESARLAVGPARDGQRIRIGHLDNGLDGTHPAAPAHLVYGDKWADAVGLLTYAQDWTKSRQPGYTGPKPTPPLPPEQTNGTHGMSTIDLPFS